jgi:hypothetical protein
MKASDIKVGKTYRNRGAGTTQRKVTGIGLEFQPERRYSAERPDGMPGVEFQQKTLVGGAMRQGFADWSAPRRLWMDSFASWAGSDASE